MINTLSLVSIVCLLKGIFGGSRLYSVCIPSVLSLKKLNNPRTQTHSFWLLWKVSKALDRILLYCNLNKSTSLTKEVYVATYFEDVLLILKGFCNSEAARGTTKYRLCVYYNRNFCYPERCLSCSLGLQFLAKPFQMDMPCSTWCEWKLFRLHLKEGISITVLAEIIANPKKILFVTADACCQ